MKRKIHDILKENRAFIGILLFQLVLTAYFIVSLFAERNVLEIRLEEMYVQGGTGENVWKVEGDFWGIENLTNDKNEAVLMSEEYAIAGGAYEIAVEYLSQKSLDNPSHSLNDSGGGCTFISDLNPSAIKLNELILDDGHNVANGRVWIQGGELKDFKMRLNYYGEGRLLIKSVILREQIRYRLVKCLTFVFTAGILDFLYILFLAKGVSLYKDNWKIILGLTVVTVIASMPVFTDFVFYVPGHDIDFHMQRIVAVAEELKNSQFPVRIMTNMLNEYGYVNSIYYCDIFLYLPAFLYNMMLPLQTCYHIYVILVNLFTCIIGYYVLDEMTHDKNLALMGTSLYTMSAYRFTNIYVRAAVGEYTAMCFLPLVVLGMWKIYSKEKVTWKEWLPLSLAMSGIIQSHILSAEMVTVILILVVIVLFKKTIVPQRIFGLIKAAVVALGLSAWFCIPFLTSMSSMSVAVQDRVYKIQRSGTYPIQLFDLFIHGNGEDVGHSVKNEMPLSIGLPFVIGIMITLCLCLYREKWKLEQEKYYLLFRLSFILSLLAMFMTSYLCPYDSVENMLGKTVAKFVGIVQFSWRYLSIATVMLTITVVIALFILKKYNYSHYKVSFVVLLCSEVLLTGIFYWQYSNSAEEYGFYSGRRQSAMYIGTGEYLLENTNTSKITVANYEVTEGILEVTGYWREKGYIWVACKNIGEVGAKLLLPVFYYDNYHVFDLKTGDEYLIETGDNNRICLNIEAGYEGILRIQYKPPFLWRLSEVISFLFLFFIIVRIWVYCRKEKGSFQNDPEKTRVGQVIIHK